MNNEMTRQIRKRLSWYVKWITCTAFLAGLSLSLWIQSAWADPIQPSGRLDLVGMGIIKFSSPTLVNLDEDPELEILIGTVDGQVVAIDYNKSLGKLTTLWSYNTSNALKAPTTIRGAISAADLDNDGSVEIVVPIGDVAAVNSSGGIVVLNAQGQLLWFYETYDTTSDSAQPDGKTDGVIGSPALGDIDNDGDLEIIFGSVDHRLYAFHHDGKLVAGWPRFIRDTVWTSPALADLNNDGTLEIIIGVDTHAEPAFGTPDGGGLYVLNADGSDFPGWPRFIDQVIYSSPAIADLDGDGSLEIIHGTGPYFDNPEAGYKLYVWNANGSLKWTGQTQGYTMSSPAVGNIDNDPQLEIVINSINDQATHAWNHDGTKLWSVVPKDLTGKSLQLMTSPMLADYNNDGKADVFVTLYWESAVLDGPTGRQLTATSFPNNPLPSYLTNHTVDSSPALGDIDGDGLLELVLASANDGSGQYGQVMFWNLDTPATLERAPWPQFSQNAAHTGYYRPTPAFDAQVVSHTLPKVALPGTTYPVSITFKNTGVETWTTNNVRLTSLGNSIPAQIALPQTVQAGQTVTLQFTWQAPNENRYVDLQWRLVQTQNSNQFGQRSAAKVKVGNQPALQVLTVEGIFAGGLASAALPSPSGLWNWSASLAWKLTDDKRGYHLLDQYGAVWTGGDGMPLWKPPVRTDYQDLVLGPDGISYWLLAFDGSIYGCHPNGCDHRFSPAPPTNITARSLALTGDGKGVYVVDGFGALYRGGNAPALPQIAGFPLGQDLIMRIKLTKSGQGYYLLDKYGRIYAGGNAPALEMKYDPRIGVNWAIDFELTDDEQGFYMLSRDGSIHAGGNAEPLTVNVPPVRNSDFARDLELIDSRRNNAPNLIVPAEFGDQFVEQGDGKSATIQKSIVNAGSIPLNWSMAAAWTSTGNLPLVEINPSRGMLLPAATQSVSISIPRIGEQPTGEYKLKVTTQASANGIEVTHTSTILILVVDQLFNIYLPATIR